ncbi:hypothetical protein DCS_06086 [Drechmeria coniospora]|uniref:Reverse transcriptase Ty1/copia-type domain-containing protein n=1 Tax=Drechmeria coniospora TaxID=98403 RepID=A0A151GAL2_DRECN|nr:hypothetical protein DCS_06086 [Drechmeria coniospora]KYK54129.1 hypothetical protein DCS_06086 [Drechmeria coniospora]
MDQRTGNPVTFHAVFTAAAAHNAPQRTHRDTLTRLPKRYQDLTNHPYGREFKETGAGQPDSSRIARICVRGDLHSECSNEQTYAATLAARTLRTVISIAARHDLDIRQFNVASGFLNTTLNSKSPIYVDLTKGYIELGFLHDSEDPPMVAQLNKALYGLRQSLLLWYNEMSQKLKAQGLLRTSEEPCVFTNDKVLILVYVDDILALSPKGHSVDDI